MKGKKSMYNDEKYPTLSRWQWEKDYIGPDFSEYFGVYSQTRDSKLYEVSNFEAVLKELGGESETVRVIRHGHWLCGWFEWIGVHYSDTETLDKVVKIKEELADYPILDEHDYYQRQAEAMDELWRSLSIEDRIEIIKEHGNSTSFLAARHDDYPNDYGIEEYLEDYVEG